MSTRYNQGGSIGNTQPTVRVVKLQSSDAMASAKENVRQDDLYILFTPLRKSQLSYAIDGVSIFDGIALPGMLRLIVPGEKWTAQVAGPFSLLRIEIPGQVWRRLLTRALLPASGILNSGYKPLLRPVSEVERLSRVLNGSPPLYIHQEMLSEGITVALLAYLFHNHRGGQTVLSKGGLTKKQLVKAIDCAHSHINTGLSTATWAESLQLLPRTFYRRFKKSTGTSPYKWFLEMRLEEAEHLLRERKLSIRDVAGRVGYANQTSFIDAFRRKHGIPPSVWKEKTLD